MRKVAVLGIGQIPVDEHWEKSVRHLAGDAAITAIADAHFEPTAVESLYVGNMLSGSLNKQESLAALIADWVGLRGIEASKIEAACGSGAAAFRSGVMMVADPINLLDASPIGDGAAAIVLCPAEKIRHNGQPIITVAASAAATDSIAVHDRFDAMRLAVAETSAQKAYAQANVTPNEIVFLNCTTLSRSWQRSRSKPAVLPNAVRVCGSV
jgi:acetyl-CoA acetyltransferase